MKTCSSCGRRYEDETLVFCLDDGTRLASASGNDAPATLRIPPPTPTQPGPTVLHRPAPPAQSTITGRPEQFHFPPRQTASETPGERRPARSSLPWILAIVVAIGVFGVLIAWIVTSGKRESVSDNYPTPKPTASVAAGTPEATPDRRETPDSTPNSTPNATPTAEPTKPKPMFSVMDNTSMDGTRITYYPRPSFGGCQADCARNPNCQGFTWIRPGAYNPGDSAMCYLMASVTGKSSHTCCISAVRN